MFEQAFIDSRVTSRKWTATAALIGETAVLTALVIVAMSRIESLPVKTLIRPPSPPLMSKPHVTELVNAGAARQGGTATLVQPTVIPSGITTSAADTFIRPGNTAAHGPAGLACVGCIPSAVSFIPIMPPPVVDVRPPQRLKTSSIDPAYIVVRIDPAYPPAARAAGIQGKVVLRALVGRDGSIDELEVISGHPMLTRSALEAVRHWRYKPTIVSGSPVEVETTITVKFVLNR